MLEDQLSVKEFKQNLKELFKKSGLLSNIKTQLRNELVSTIKSDHKVIAEKIEDRYKPLKDITNTICFSASTQTDLSGLSTNEFIEMQLKDSKNVYKNELELEYQKRLNRLIDKENDMKRSYDEKERSFLQSLYEARQFLQEEINNLREKEMKIKADIIEIELHRNDILRKEKEFEVRNKLFEAKERENKSNIQDIQRLSILLKDSQLNFNNEKESLYKEIELLKNELSFEINKNSSLQLKLSESKGREVTTHLQELQKLTTELRENSIQFELERKSYQDEIDSLKKELNNEINKNLFNKMKFNDKTSYEDIKSQFQEIQRLTLENKEIVLKFETEKKLYLHDKELLENEIKLLKEKNSNLINHCKELEKQLKLQQQINNNIQLINKDYKLNNSGIIRSSTISSPSRSIHEIDHSKRISDMVSDILVKSNIRSNTVKSFQSTLTSSTLSNTKPISPFPTIQVHDPRDSIDNNNYSNNQQTNGLNLSNQSSYTNPFQPVKSAFSPVYPQSLIQKQDQQVSNHDLIESNNENNKSTRDDNKFGYSNILNTADISNNYQSSNYNTTSIERDSLDQSSKYNRNDNILINNKIEKSIEISKYDKEKMNRPNSYSSKVDFNENYNSRVVHNSIERDSLDQSNRIAVEIKPISNNQKNIEKIDYVSTNNNNNTAIYKPNNQRNQLESLKSDISLTTTANIRNDDTYTFSSKPIVERNDLIEEKKSYSDQNISNNLPNTHENNEILKFKAETNSKSFTDNKSEQKDSSPRIKSDTFELIPDLTNQYSKLDTIVQNVNRASLEDDNHFKLESNSSIRNSPAQIKTTELTDSSNTKSSTKSNNVSPKDVNIPIIQTVYGSLPSKSLSEPTINQQESIDVKQRESIDVPIVQSSVESIPSIESSSNDIQLPYEKTLDDYKNEVIARKLRESRDKPFPNVAVSFSTISVRDSASSMKTEEIPIIDNSDDESIEVLDENSEDSDGWS